MTSLNNHLANLSLDALESLARTASRVLEGGTAPSPRGAFARLAVSYGLSSASLASVVLSALETAYEDAELAAAEEDPDN